MTAERNVSTQCRGVSSKGQNLPIPEGNAMNIERSVRTIERNTLTSSRRIGIQEARVQNRILRNYLKIIRVAASFTRRLEALTEYSVYQVRMGRKNKEGLKSEEREGGEREGEREREREKGEKGEEKEKGYERREEIEEWRKEMERGMERLEEEGE